MFLRISHSVSDQLTTNIFSFSALFPTLPILPGISTCNIQPLFFKMQQIPTPHTKLRLNVFCKEAVFDPPQIIFRTPLLSLKPTQISNKEELVITADSVWSSLSSTHQIILYNARPILPQCNSDCIISLHDSFWDKIQRI